MAELVQIITTDNHEIFSIPSWLTAEYLENTLKIYKKDENLKIRKLKIVPATKKGENYASIMFRAHIEYTYYSTAQKQNDIYPSKLIIKVPFEGDDFIQEKLLEYGVCQTEMDIYSSVFPRIKRLLSDVNDEEQLFPDIISVDYQQNAIIFEDLSQKNYIMAERNGGLNMVHVKLVLRKLAKMHAACARLEELEPGFLQKFNRGMFNRKTSAFSPYFVDNIETCGNMIRNWKGFECYGDKLLALKDFVMEYGRRCCDPDPSHFNALIHGDLWITNAMFIYPDGGEKKVPKDSLLIDFQYCCWTSPTVDLHYFFNTSLDEDLRLHHQDEMVEYYYRILVETLEKLKFQGKIPSLKEFWLQFLQKEFYAFISSCLMQPVSINENTDNADFRALIGVDERAKDFKKMIYKNPIVQRNLKNLLPIFNRKGLLDI